MMQNLDKLKAEMKEAKSSKTFTHSQLEKKYGNNVHFDVRERKNNLLLFMYSPSKTIPVKVGNLIINYKLYEAFIKKIKGFQRSTSLTDHGLKVEYWNGKSRGTFELDDISYYFQGFKHIPEVSITDDQET